MAALVEEGSDTSVFDADVRVADTRQGLGRLAAGYAAAVPGAARGGHRQRRQDHR